MKIVGSSNNFEKIKGSNYSILEAVATLLYFGKFDLPQIVLKVEYVFFRFISK